MSTNNLPELRACKAIIRELFSSRYKRIAWIFHEPVEAALLGLYDYNEIVKEPMDLTTIRHRLLSNFYLTADSFARDMRLIFHNTYLYTTPNHICYQMALQLESVFEDMFSKVPKNAPSMDFDYKIDPDVDLSFISPTLFMQSHETTSLREGSVVKEESDEYETPLTYEENLELHKKVLQLKGEVLLNVIHMIHQLEGSGAKYSNKGLEFDVTALKNHTKRSILNYMANKGITGKRVRRQNRKYLF